MIKYFKHMNSNNVDYDNNLLFFIVIYYYYYGAVSRYISSVCALSTISIHLLRLEARASRLRRSLMFVNLRGSDVVQEESVRRVVAAAW